MESKRRVKPQSKEISLNQKAKEYLHIWEDDIRSACGFQAIMQYYDHHWVQNIALLVSLCPRVVHSKGPVHLSMSGF